MLSVAKIFQSHMILQQNKPIRIWGTAEPLAKVQAAIGAERAAVRADAAGAWMLELPPRTASVGNTLHIECEEEQIDLRDIGIGEVWLAGGQSNMEFHMKFDREFDAVLAAARFPDIRFYDVPEIAYEAGFRANPNNNRVILLDDPMNIIIMRDGLSREEQVAFVEQIMAMAGVEDLGEDAPPLMNYGPKSEHPPFTIPPCVSKLCRMGEGLSTVSGPSLAGRPSSCRQSVDSLKRQNGNFFGSSHFGMD